MLGYCDMGKERHVLTNVTCISCQRQEVPCPFTPLPLCADPGLVVADNGKKPKGARPNKTEGAYGRLLRLEFPDCEVRYEALTLVLDLDGERFKYRPDWTVFLPGGGILCVEVKNSGFKHASYGRSKLAFAAARVQWPMFSFRWAALSGGAWDVENF